jgi:hypothetical protein
MHIGRSGTFPVNSISPANASISLIYHWLEPIISISNQSLDGCSRVRQVHHPGKESSLQLHSGWVFLFLKGNQYMAPMGQRR